MCVHVCVYIYACTCTCNMHAHTYGTIPIYMCIGICMHTCEILFACTCTCVLTNLHRSVCVNVSIPNDRRIVYLCVHMYRCNYVCVRVYACDCVRVCMYPYICVCMCVMCTQVYAYMEDILPQKSFKAGLPWASLPIGQILPLSPCPECMTGCRSR